MAAEEVACVIQTLHAWFIHRFPLNTQLVISTHLKNMLVKMGIFPNFRDENSKDIWNHHHWTIETFILQKVFYTPEI